MKKIGIFLLISLLSLNAFALQSDKNLRNDRDHLKGKNDRTFLTGKHD
jgi:hypothetical protein